MREIKFRVWNGNKINYMDDFPSWSAFWDMNDPTYDSSSLVFQQFTGFKDKKNREIYEGDIVKANNEHITYHLNEFCGKYTNGVVKWIDTAFKICESKIGATFMNDFITCDCCPCGLEIIGNIFENPELLK